jgi:hypothetical protein
MDAKDAELLASEGVLETDVKSIINSFYMQSLLNPKLSKCVGHIPLSFSPDDTPRLTDHFMKCLAKEYMQAMGIENTQYIIVRHNNTNHPHCHIVFNRVDNEGKTISDKNDRYRNEKVCKQLKDKYNLTYGKGKENVNVQKLKGAEHTRYEIYHTVKDALLKSKNWQQFEQTQKQHEISIEYKRKGQTDEVQGISFRKGEHCFKGSEIDRKFSYSKLDAAFNGNTHSQKQQQEQQQQEVIPNEAQHTCNNITENVVSGVANVVSGIGSLFDMQPSGQDETEAECQRQQALNRKKKLQKRRGIRR